MEIDKIYNIDCIEGMKEMPDDFVDLTITSPPWGNIRNFGGHNDYDFEECAKQLFRITKEGRCVVWVVGDQTIDGDETGVPFEQALYFKKIGFKLLDTMIYQKNSTLMGSPNRYKQCFEYMFVFTKGKVKVVNLIKDRANKLSGRELGITKRRKGDILVSAPRRKVQPYGVRYNIWTYITGSYSITSDMDAFLHPAMFPEQLAKDHIISWSNEGDLVFDPFSGSGTTCKMAYLLKRHYLGMEINPEYYELSIKRMERVKKQGMLGL